MDELGGASPLQLLQDDFGGSDQEIRLKAIKRVTVVAEVLGPEATRSELIPFVNQIVDEDDELLLALATELAGGFVPLVGGNAHAYLLLPCLENLAAVEETVVREQAVASLCAVIPACEGYVEHVLGLVKRLSGGDWFTARVSSCGLHGAAYRITAAAEARAQLRGQFDALSKDDTPMVRRAAAAKLGDFVSAMESEYIVAELLPVFTALANDDQDSVRRLAVEAAAPLAAALEGTAEVGDNNNNNSNDAAAGADQAHSAVSGHVLTAVKHAAEDRSWRVRQGAAKCLAAVAAAAPKAGAAQELSNSLVLLLQDPETDVRAAAVASLPEFADLLGPDAFCRAVMQTLLNLTQDVALPVRNALSEVAMVLTPKLGEESMDQLLLPMLQTFLRDESPEVRLHVLSNMEALSEWLPSLTEALLPLVLELGQDNVWRVRKAVVLAIPLLTERLGMAYFDEHLADLYFKAYEDSVNEVRMGAAEGLPLLCRACGGDWVLEKLLPRIRGFYDAASFYLIRITVVNALKRLVTGPDGGSANHGGDGGSAAAGGGGATADADNGNAAAALLAPHALELTLRAARDPIPNVRFTAVRALQEMGPLLEDAVVAGQVTPCLASLARHDTDPDVKYFATQALEALR